jgi:hypothetical protein
MEVARAEAAIFTILLPTRMVDNNRLGFAIISINKEALCISFLTKWCTFNVFNDMKAVSVAEKKADINNKMIRISHSHNATTCSVLLYSQLSY